ncbi:hypothetical protein [Pantanalinema sp. GBBB05]|uniref:hypothetical protein n=1 Tax=Pantanalinema sp. GBBB05 TaxID=2604139 RepID=UPI001D81135D|nr:hypothetical protein [Pantanalinema sp. GBBB05]
MRVWLTCFVLLFGAAELFQWMQHLSLPMPVFILGGLFLAVASNYDKLTNLPFHLDYQEPPPPTPKPLNQNSSPAIDTSAQPTTTNSPTRPTSFTIRKSEPSSRSISFTIQKPVDPLQPDKRKP